MILQLILLLCGILYVAFFYTNDDAVLNTKMFVLFRSISSKYLLNKTLNSGIGAGVGVLLLTGLLEFKDGPFIRVNTLYLFL